MNSRIEIVDSMTVKIKGHPDRKGCYELIANTSNGMNLDKRNCERGDSLFCSDWDAEGRAALRDCINCLEATGSFAALSDESAGVFIGKQVREKSAPHRVHEIVHIGEQYVRMVDVETDSLRTTDVDNLLPLTPAKPKVRPYTPVEAAAHIKRPFKSPRFIGTVRHVCSVELPGIRDEFQCYYSFKDLASGCTWGDDGSICGVPERN